MRVKLVSQTKISDSYLVELMQAATEDDKDFVKNVQGSEALMAYIARVSSPTQKNPSYEGLLGYCAKHGHWSVFEQINVTFEIETSRAIAQQILRHRSFVFQEFSQRYAKVDMGFELCEARRQDNKNRQNSISDMSQEDCEWFKAAQEKVWETSYKLYSEAVERGVAREQSRFLLPLNTTTKLYMTGNLRNWIHYIDVRGGKGTQQEHADIANAIKDILIREFPIVSKAVGWSVSNED